MYNRAGHLAVCAIVSAACVVRLHVDISAKVVTELLRILKLLF